MLGIPLFTILLVFVGTPIALVLVSAPALLQWPVPISQARRPQFAGPRMAGGGWR